ncbi:hypothetical protein ABIC37_005881 [Priestia megaterium]|uniref:hypothetical protein n=1 Tax=Priestia megaterium TaxID=1404 RepID=UPI00339B4A30
MFKSFLVQELAKRLGSQIEITLDNGSVEGVLSSVSGNFITIIPAVTYGNTASNPVFVSISAINGIEFPQGV